jgi:hypothetical protein
MHAVAVKVLSIAQEIVNYTTTNDKDTVLYVGVQKSTERFILFFVIFLLQSVNGFAT